MSDKQSNLTDKEMEDLQSIVTDTLASVCAMADKHNIDRDSMLKYFADMLTAFTEVASIQNYETNHTNADRIRNMSDEELAEFLAYNAYCEECYVKKDDSCCYPDGTCKQKHLEWLQSEAE
jgi:hypothetical protein|nr:MAG TPA: hypothetical protein [Caudoviricetes sp.]